MIQEPESDLNIGEKRMRLGCWLDCERVNCKLRCGGWSEAKGAHENLFFRPMTKLLFADLHDS